MEASAVFFNALLRAAQRQPTQAAMRSLRRVGLQPLPPLPKPAPVVVNVAPPPVQVIKSQTSAPVLFSKKQIGEGRARHRVELAELAVKHYEKFGAFSVTELDRHIRATNRRCSRNLLTEILKNDPRFSSEGHNTHIVWVVKQTPNP